MNWNGDTRALLWETVTKIACSGWEIHGRPQSIGSVGWGLYMGPPEKESTRYSHTSSERNEVLLFCLWPYQPTGFARVSVTFWRKQRLRNVLFCSNKCGSLADKQNYGLLPIIAFRPLSLTCILVDILSANASVATFSVISVLIRLLKGGFPLPTTRKYRWSRCIFPFIVTLETI